MDDLFAKHIQIQEMSDCQFYHVMDLPRSGTTPGDWDLRGRFDDYIGGVPFSGKTVLDVGTANGFLTFEAEKRGAAVVSVDARSVKDLDKGKLFMPQSLYSTDHEQWEHSLAEQVRKIRNAYWLAHQEFESTAKAHYGSIYELPSELGQFDVVIVGQILVHLTDVIRALSSVAQRCQGTLVIAEGMIDDERPASFFLGRADRPDNDHSFWHHSTGLYREMMAIFGFSLKSKTIGSYKCNRAGWAASIEITTLVFERTDSDV